MRERQPGMFSSLSGLLRGIFDFFGVFPRDAKIVFLGLDNAGKTTLLGMLKEQRLSAAQPTLHASCEEMVIDNIRFRTYDVGGHVTARRIWGDWFPAVHGVVFIVDAADRTRFEEAKEELTRILGDECLRNKPIAVLGNKIDIPYAASEEELRRALGLEHHMTCDVKGKKGDNGPRQLFMCSVAKQMGYGDALKWLGSMIV